tara:strand:+ start:106203 stop:107732 length:1530 start_codon:yes stop_codon:yes gene_type:complete
MLKIILGNTSCRIIGHIDDNVLKELDNDMSYKFPGYQFMRGRHGVYNPYSSNLGGWDGRVRLLTKGRSFPAGLLSRTKSILNKNKVEYSVVDNREDILLGKELGLCDGEFIPRDYQIAVVNKGFDVGGGIVRSATGSGKTSMIAMLVAKFNINTVIYVIGIELLYQMKETIERLYGIECGIVGGGHCDTSKNVTIMTVWSAASAFNKKCKLMDSDVTHDNKRKNKLLNKRDVIRKVESANLIIIDECQYAASETVQFLHRSSKSAKYRFLFSGTPWRDSGDDILIESVGGPKFYDLNATTLIKKNFLVPPEIHFINVPIMKNVGKNYHEVYTNYIVNNEERNGLIKDAVRRLVGAGKKVLILVVRVAHGDVLLDMLEEEFRVEYLDGGKSIKQRLGAISDMKEGRLDVLIASKIFDQGVDIPQLDALIVAGSGKSSGRALQRIGRVIRPWSGKSSAIVVDFFDNAKYLREHSERRIGIYGSEPGFKIKLPSKISKRRKNKKVRDTNWLS